MTGIIATFFWIGRMRPAPGTWGSAAALPWAWVIHGLAGFPGLVLATVLAFGLGWWATAEETRGKADHDPGEIVIDEVVGVWIALWPLSAGLWHAGAEPWVLKIWASLNLDRPSSLTAHNLNLYRVELASLATL